VSSVRLVSIEVEGFRVLQPRFKVSLRSPRGGASDVVVIAGPNGTGKTSLLEAILLAMGQESLIEQTLAKEVAIGHWRAALPPGARIALVFSVESAPGTSLGAYAPCEVRLQRTAADWRLELIRDGQMMPLHDQVRASFLTDVAVEYLSSWRSPFQIGGLRASTTTAEIPKDERYRYFRLKQRIINERSARGFSGRDTFDAAWLARLNEIWDSWHDGADTKIDALETGDAERPFDLFLVKDVGDGPEQVCPLDMASSGELEWITLAGTLITEDFDGLLLIDEPELHLHPQWQARLLPSLRKLAPGAQLIVATHSSFPWDQALPYQRVLLLPPGDPRRPKKAAE
jgi:energy-coupling factor transporter ATP-binding protein EcfA2